MENSSHLLSDMLDHLRTFTAGKEVLTPKQLESVLGISAKQQSVLRKEHKMVIPHIAIGNKILYSIHAVASVLLPNTNSQPDFGGKTDGLTKAAKTSTQSEKRTKWREGLKTPRSAPSICLRNYLWHSSSTTLNPKSHDCRTCLGN